MTSTRPRHVVLIFLDGVGIGADDSKTNPWVSSRFPCLRSLLGNRIPTHDSPCLTGERAAVFPADATLGIAGLPQSGTGQTALLTGVNAARLFGRHFGPWVPTPLRPMLADANLLAHTARAGRAARFANAYPSLEPGRRPAAPTLAAHTAGLLTGDAAALRQGRAVASSITNDAWQRFAPDARIPSVSPGEAGRTLARLASDVDLTLFAHYDTDIVGHRGDHDAAEAALERVDAFLGGLLDVVPEDALVVVTSDHGNLEDTRGGHTRNPVPVIAIGPGRETLATQVRTITDVVPALLRLLEIP